MAYDFGEVDAQRGANRCDVSHEGRICANCAALV
jgi:hypothetical protein